MPHTSGVAEVPRLQGQGNKREDRGDNAHPCQGNQVACACVPAVVCVCGGWLADQQPRSRRRARRAHMEVSETDGARVEAVDVRGLNHRVAVAPELAVALVILWAPKNEPRKYGKVQEKERVKSLAVSTKQMLGRRGAGCSSAAADARGPADGMALLLGAGLRVAAAWASRRLAGERAAMAGADLCVIEWRTQR